MKEYFYLFVGIFIILLIIIGILIKILKESKNSFEKLKEEKESDALIFKEQLTKSLKEQNEQNLNFFQKLLSTTNEGQLKGLNSILSNTDLIKESQTKNIQQIMDVVNGLNKSVNNFDNMLNNKQLRGAFGERNLEEILTNTLSSRNFEKQKSLSNDSRVDFAILFNKKILCVDSKFPLDTFRKIIEKENEKNSSDSVANYKKFEQDIKKHINDISEKYIITNETLEFAVMFIPSDALYVEICQNHESLLQYAASKRVIVSSPNTIMTILTLAYSIREDYIIHKSHKKMKKELEIMKDDCQRGITRLESLKIKAQQTVDECNNLSITFEKTLKRIEKIVKIPDIPDSDYDSHIGGDGLNGDGLDKKQ